MRGDIFDPGALGTGPGEHRDKGAWPRDVVGPETCLSIPSWMGSKTPEKHVNAKPSGEEWQVGKNINSREAYPAIEIQFVCQGGYFILCTGYQVPCQRGF